MFVLYDRAASIISDTYYLYVLFKHCEISKYGIRLKWTFGTATPLCIKLFSNDIVSFRITYTFGQIVAFRDLL